jgi:uncharacterized protein (DUF433 family)
MAALLGIGELITQTPGVNGGRPCIAGTGVSVAHIAELAEEGLTPEQIVDEVLSPVTLAQVHAALAYYLTNRVAIEADRAEQERLYHELAAQRFGQRE